ncbi:hypothetical protein DB313_04870 (plasmid) [Borrelia turcica IST7]|uniref:Uncharacterized protein n=1 Tax=Borrelia turcica IST7 TaxID=1104446 RepID=A0A386PMN8_9SPIR|nr:DUF693 family protein [Borrelia turcica]AYE36834.1 hypothetical protein DB313_04870 [Borrelia turcica IST7]
MLLFQYNFKIEFYSVNRGAISLRPKLVIKTKDGAPLVNILISNEYLTSSLMQCKKARLQLFNMPLNFNKSLKIGDVVKIYYGKFSYEANIDYKFIMAGYLGAPIDFDFENGDFICEYDVYLITKDTFLNKKLPVKNFHGQSLEDAIREVFKDKAVIHIGREDRERTIDESFYVSTFKEFIEKLLGKYVHSIFVDSGDLTSEVDTRFIFINFNALGGVGRSYKNLQDYALLFIPQKEVRALGQFTFNFWNATLLFTDKIKVGDRVKFINRYGEVVKAIVQETSAHLSNIGDCTLKLKLYDESNELGKVVYE